MVNLLWSDETALALAATCAAPLRADERSNRGREQQEPLDSYPIDRLHGRPRWRAINATRY
jgi:hypothetical protein